MTRIDGPSPQKRLQRSEGARRTGDQDERVASSSFEIPPRAPQHMHPSVRSPFVAATEMQAVLRSILPETREPTVLAQRLVESELDRLLPSSCDGSLREEILVLFRDQPDLQRLVRQVVHESLKGTDSARR